jgi:mitochondrial fission protein ELM1
VVLDAQSVETVKILIITDGKKGHENQSIAYANLLNKPYTLCTVTYASKWHKMLTYALDWLGIYVPLFSATSFAKKEVSQIVCAGSSTYYPAKMFAKHYNLPVTALMLPRGYKQDYTHIFAMAHDNPPQKPNITSLPVNICQSRPLGLFAATSSTLGVVIGGRNAVFTCNAEEIRALLGLITHTFPDHALALATSPRTPAEVDNVVEATPSAFTLIYAKTPKNPIGDFLFTCTGVCITEDSTSMLSEAVCWGQARVHILPLESSKPHNKYRQFASFLVNEGYAQWLGEPLIPVKKYDLKAALQKANT